jgi:hypothetical protein
VCWEECGLGWNVATTGHDFLSAVVVVVGIRKTCSMIRLCGVQNEQGVQKGRKRHGVVGLDAFELVIPL